MSAFTDALEAGDIAAIRACPKADLHAHTAASGNRGFIRERTGKDIAPVAVPLTSMDDMHAWFAEHIGDIFKGVEGHALAWEAAFVQAKADGVTRIELGDDCWMITQGYASAQDIARTRMAVHRATAPDIEWVRQVSMSRHCSHRALDLWLSPFLELGFYQTFDLSGDELIQPIETFVPLYRKAKAAGLRTQGTCGRVGNGGRRVQGGRAAGAG